MSVGRARSEGRRRAFVALAIAEASGRIVVTILVVAVAGSAGARANVARNLDSDSRIYRISPIP